MKRVFLRLLMTIFLASSAYSAEPLTDGQIKVASRGVTDLVATLSKNMISIKISTHEVDIGKSSDAWPQKRLTSCTYSHFPCSLVDYIEISVNGNNIFVPRSVYADVSDVVTASLHQKKNGQFLMIMHCGDASESYTVEIAFDKNSIRQREFKSNLNRQILQRTTYFPSRTLDD